MDNNSYQLVLASQSPRRLELLKTLYLPFKVQASDIEEHTDYESPGEIVQDLASQKSQEVFNQLKGNTLVIGADTIVCLEDQVLGKPTSRQEAQDMLNLLAGKSHHVYTGVSLISKSGQDQFFSRTEVTFGKISPDLMQLYLDTGESMDKAGSYGIQSFALSFIRGIEGSYSNVVGLPVDQLLTKIKEHIGADDPRGEWRKLFV